MDVLELTAVQFIRPMKNGRTRPLLLGCEDLPGNPFEVVVKLRGRQMAEKAQIAELIAAQLADDLNLDVPRAGVVEVPAGFEEIVTDPEAAAAVKESIGFNFGSVHLGTGFTTWPPNRSPHGAQRDQAASIFAFDTLLQNPDRRTDNPNLWVRSDRLGVYDHEQAFSFLFLPIIGGASRPWVSADQANAFRFLEKHIFYSALRGSSFDLEGFQERLGSLTDEQLGSYAVSVPAEWREGNDVCERVIEYLREARDERSKLTSFINHMLR